MHISKKQKLHLILSWSAVIVWMLVIFTLSAQPGEESTHLSDKVAEIILKRTNIVFSQDTDITAATAFVKSLKYLLRKCAHLGEYFILGILVMNAVRASKVPMFKAIVLSALICVLYAVSDEMHQYFVPGREAQVTDVLIDGMGALAGIGLRPLIKRRNSPSYVE